MKKFLAFIIFISLSFSQYAQHQYHCRHADPTAQERNHPVDITHMKVDVSFDTKAGKVFGKVKHDFTTIQKNIDTLFFDAPGIEIKTAKIDGKTAEFKIIPTGVVVMIKDKWNFDEKHSIDFEYVASPKKGLYFIGWNEPKVENASVWHTRQQIWTQGQGIDNRHWIPMYDDMGDKFYTETVITFDEEYQVLSNGDLLSKTKQKDGKIKWHYKLNNPHPGYLLMIAIGEYAVKSTKTKRGTPVNFWYYPEFEERAKWTSMHTEKMIEFLEDETGVAYPWGAYSQVMVQDFLYGAMENTSATIFGDFFFVDDRAFLDRNYVGVNCHELTHQWFGDLVTARGPGDAWLQESFATYYAKIFDAQIIDDNEVKFNFRRETQSALNASKKDLYPIRHTKSGTARIYPKGSAVLQMLRNIVGDEEFKRAINYFVEKHKFGNINTDDLQQAFKDKLGMNMDWFFEQWVWQGNEPHYDVKFSQYGNMGTFKIKQIHETTMANGFFKMPIDFTIAYKDGSVDRKKEWVEGETSSLSFDTKGKDIAYVLFDENCQILKQVTFNKPERMLIRQAQEAEHAIDRYDAILALKSKKDDEKVGWYTEWYKNEKAYQVRRAMIAQMAGNEKALELLKLASQDENARVREELAKGIDANWGKLILEGLLSDKSYKVVEAAFDNLANSGIAFDANIVKGVDGINNAIATKYAAYQYSNLGAEEFAKKLGEMAGPAYEFRTRINAFNALKSINYMNEEVAKNLMQATTALNGRLARPAKSTVAYFKTQAAFRKFFK